MSIQELIELVEHRIAALKSMRNAAWTCGDVSGVITYDAQIASSQQTLAALKTLLV